MNLYSDFSCTRCIHDRLYTEDCYDCERHTGDRFHNPRPTDRKCEPVYFPPSRINDAPSLPSDSAERKALPVTEGVLHYFPRAIAYVSRVSKVGNDKHNPGEALHWSKSKSYDHLSCVGRHLIDAGKRGDAGLRETGYLAWRALAALEVELEAAEARGESW